MTLERGTLLNERYRVVEILGQGGMGSVYRAIDENLGVEVALKENLFTTEEYARQFRREAIILATLRHPNLTRVTDHFVIEGQGQYLVMDYIEGDDLRQRMDRVGILPEQEVVIIGAAVCDALRYLEGSDPPIVHRDIKPGNVKITSNGHIYLVDFGLAKLIQKGQATTTGARAMTPGYSPPEQYGTARTDHRSDLFSLGATLYAALTGAIPEDALARAMDQTKLTPIRRHNPRISKRMAAVIEKSLAIRPDDRYQSANDFKQALLDVLNGNKRRKTGEYMLQPIAQEGLNPNLFQDTPVSNSPASAANELGGNNSPQPLPVSTPIPDPYGRSGPSALSRFFRVLLIAILLLGLAGVVLYYLNPAFPAQALALLMPAPENSLIGMVGNPTPTNTTVPSDTPVPAVAVVSSATPTTEPSPTPEPTETVQLPTETEPFVVPPSPTPTATPVGGGSGEIAFASDRSGTTQVWVMNIDGSNMRQVSDMPEGACQPSWSPDGARLVFISPCEKNDVLYRGTGLFMANADGSDVTPLANVPGGDFDPAWSPGGNKIAFASVRITGRPRIYAIELSDNSVEMLSTQYSYDRQPAWSSDGQHIAFVTTQKGPVQIWTMEADGSNQDIYSRSADAINTYPSWSVNGEMIMFNQVDRPGGIPSIVVASYDNGDYSEFRYDMGPVPVKEPRYSPDGLWLVFESWPRGSNHDIFIMTASGAGRVQLTDDPFLDFDPAWRPKVVNP
jgi:serine/threonine protein kinase